ncbi:MAG TPA: hypothetical protein VL463_00335, partial [Kofleriaceae bacterium]|nr:hypothetical protein [Kofleriaceae bacterium]
VADAIVMIDEARALADRGDHEAALARMDAVYAWIAPLFADDNIRRRFARAPGMQHQVRGLAWPIVGAVGRVRDPLRWGATPRGLWGAAIDAVRGAREILELLAGLRDPDRSPLVGDVERAHDTAVAFAGVVTIAIAAPIAIEAAPLLVSEAQLIGWGAKQAAWTALALVLENPIATVTIGELAMDTILTVGLAGGLTAYARDLLTPRGALGLVLDIFHARAAIASTRPTRAVITRIDDAHVEARVIAPARPRGAKRFGPRTRARLETMPPAQAERLRRRLARAGDDIVEAAERFDGVDGFDEVLASYNAGGNPQKGARFVLRWALANIPDPRGRALSFEMPSMDGMRRVDVFLDGIRYELKSVREVRASLVRGSGGKLGQLTKDFAFTEGDPERLRWVFDSAEGMSHSEIVAAFRQHLQDGFLAGHPLLTRFSHALERIVVTWP